MFFHQVKVKIKSKITQASLNDRTEIWDCQHIIHKIFFPPKWKGHTNYGGILTYKKRTDKIIYRKVGEVNIFTVILFPCLKAELDLTWNTKIDASTAVLHVFLFKTLNMTVGVAVSANLNLMACVIQMQLFPRHTREDSVFSVLNFANSVGQQLVTALTREFSELIGH